MDIHRTSTKTGIVTRTATDTRWNRIESQFPKCVFSASMFCIRNCTDWSATLSLTTWGSPTLHCECCEGVCGGVVTNFFHLPPQPAVRHLENWTRPTLARLHWHFLRAEPPLRIEGICPHQRPEGLALRPDLTRRTAAPHRFGFHFAGKFAAVFRW